MKKEYLYKVIDDLQPMMVDVSRKLWNNPQVGGEEKESADLVKAVLQNEGFHIKDSKLQTAFYAEFGSGKPSIAVLGEYDALPGLSQEVVTEKKPCIEGGAGHGCAHNLLGSAAMIASIALKRFLQKTGSSGTIRFYGCPEEELLSGKVKMIAEGLFKGLDAVLTWHPMDSNQVYDGAYLANISMKFYFKGLSSHAGFAPERGRSALDAVELMSVGANYLREHVVDRTRIHYTTDSGGFAPNIVPDKASAWYFIRAPHVINVKDTARRLKLVAEGAAMMTETTVRIKQGFGCSEFLELNSFGDLAYKNMLEAPLPEYTTEELSFAKNLQEKLKPEVKEKMQKLLDENSSMHSKVATRNLWKENPMSASSDSGDVSQIVPSGFFTTACFPVGVAPHTWQATASAGCSIGEKGALYAAKIITGIAYDLFENPKTLQEIKKEFESKKDINYEPILPTE